MKIKQEDGTPIIMHLLTNRSTNKGFNTHNLLIKKSKPVAPPKNSRDFFLYSYGMGLANIVQLNKKLFSPLKTILKKSENDTLLQLEI